MTLMIDMLGVLSAGPGFYTMNDTCYFTDYKPGESLWLDILSDNGWEPYNGTLGPPCDPND